MRGAGGTVSIVIPMFREETRIDAATARLRGQFGPDGPEVVFVDDGSDDGTVAVLEAALADVTFPHRVICLGRNAGKGAAVRAGVLAARGEVVAFVDADLSSGPEDVLAVTDALDASGADVAIGSRACPGSDVVHAQPLPRRLASRAFNLAVRGMGLCEVRDSQCGLKAFTRRAASLLFSPLQTQGFAFDLELLYRARRAGLRVVEVGVTWAHRGDSTVRPASDGFRMLADAVRIRRLVPREGIGEVPVLSGAVPGYEGEVLLP